MATSALFAAARACAISSRPVPTTSHPRTWVTLAPADLGPDPVEDGHDFLQDGLRGVVAELVAGVVRVGAYDRDRFQVLAQGQELPVVLEQHDSFAGRPQGQIGVGRGVHRPGGGFGVHVGVVEQPEPDFCVRIRRTARSTRSIGTFPSLTLSASSCMKAFS